MKCLSFFAIAVVFAASAHLVQASGPVAVYALIDKVMLEPNALQPDTIRIDGVFSVAEGSGGSYSAPQRGYLYVSTRPQQVEQDRREWQALQAVAGSRQVVGFGTAWAGNFRVRPANEPAKSPDAYSLNVGVMSMNADHPRARPLLEFKDR